MYLFREQLRRVYRHAALLREMLRSFFRIGLLFSVYPFLWLLIVAAVRGFRFALSRLFDGSADIVKIRRTTPAPFYHHLSNRPLREGFFCFRALYMLR